MVETSKREEASEAAPEKLAEAKVEKVVVKIEKKEAEKKSRWGDKVEAGVNELVERPLSTIGKVTIQGGIPLLGLALIGVIKLVEKAANILQGMVTSEPEKWAQVIIDELKPKKKDK